MRQLSVGFIGLRHLHPRSYMPVFAAVEGVNVVAVAEADSAVLDAFAAEYPVRPYRDWRAMLGNERLDLAVLFLPHSHCPDAAVACAEHGVHVLAEKPMAADSDGLKRMIDAAGKAGVLLSAPYVWRYHPVARAMKQQVESGVLGQIVSCEGRCAAGRMHRYLDGHAEWMLSKSLSGGGPMHNLGVHWIDLYRWMLADEVVEVQGKNVKINQEYDIEDNSFAILTFSRGTVLSLDVSYTVPDSFPYGRDLHLGVRGTRGVLSWNPSFEGVKERLLVWSDTPGGALDFELPPQPGYAGICTVGFLQELAESIRTGRPAPITGQDGLRALEVVEAIYRSAESGRAVQP